MRHMKFTSWLRSPFSLGWAEAGRAVELLLEQIKELGGKIVPGASLDALLYSEDGTDVRGVRTKNAQEFYADKVIIATGSWTPSILGGGLLPSGLITATGQTIACIQLTEELRKKYEHIPVTMNLGGSGSGGGFYSFPASDFLQLELLLGVNLIVYHSPLQTAYSNARSMLPASLQRMECPRRLWILPLRRRGRRRGSVSGSVLASSPHADFCSTAWIPKASLDALRQSLALQYPELAAREFGIARPGPRRLADQFSNSALHFHPHVLVQRRRGWRLGHRLFSAIPIPAHRLGRRRTCLQSEPVRVGFLSFFLADPLHR